MKKKIIFLDRDGVINKNRDDYVKSPTEFEFVREIEKWLKILKNHDFKLIVITNQSMIGRGLASKTDLKKIHIKMQNHFLKQGFKIDRIYYCPHTPNDNCNCRKPKTKLLKKAINDFNVDLKNSWLIGDKDSDVIAGKKVGCNTIKIKTNSILEGAVKKILNNQQNLSV